MKLLPSGARTATNWPKLSSMIELSGGGFRTSNKPGPRWTQNSQPSNQTTPHHRDTKLTRPNPQPTKNHHTRALRETTSRTYQPIRTLSRHPRNTYSDRNGLTRPRYLPPTPTKPQLKLHPRPNKPGRERSKLHPTNAPWTHSSARLLLVQ